MNENLNDKAIEALAMVREVELLMHGVNDYGDATGFCDEQEQIVNDFHAMLGSMRARLFRLRRRLRLHSSSNTKVKDATYDN